MANKAGCWCVVKLTKKGCILHMKSAISKFPPGSDFSVNSDGNDLNRRLES